MIRSLLMGMTGLSAVLLLPANASEETADEFLKEDTVVCLKNDVEGEEVLTAIGEFFYNAKPNARKVTLEEGKSVCVRYRRASQIKPYFALQADMEGEFLKEGAKQAECQRTKGGFAKYYVLKADGKGRLKCEVDREREAEDIRVLVKGRKAINS